MFKFKFICVFIISAFILAACGAGQEQPTAVPQTIDVPVTVEVTRLVEVETEVTVEVPVEVTRIVTETVVQTEEVPVEVTRLVEVVVTATPEPTGTPDPSSTGQTGGFSDAQLLASMNSLRSNLLELGGMLDGRTVYCDIWLEKHDQIANMPTYNTASANDTSKWAYEQYRAAIDTFVFAAKDMTTNARESCVPGSSIPFQQWGTARQGINNSIDILQPAIKALGGE